MHACKILCCSFWFNDSLVFKMQSINIKTRQLFRSIFSVMKLLSQTTIFPVQTSRYTSHRNFLFVINWRVSYDNGGDIRQCFAKRIIVLCFDRFVSARGICKILFALVMIVRESLTDLLTLTGLWCEVRKGLVETNKDKLRCWMRISVSLILHRTLHLANPGTILCCDLLLLKPIPKLIHLLSATINSGTQKLI